MGDTNTVNLGDNAQAKQVAAGQNISQTYIENYIERARLYDARFSLPAPPRNFTGRADEIETLVNAFARGQGSDAIIASITGISGLGGIGKSALAAVVANRIAQNFPGAQLWLDLRGTDKDYKKPFEAMREIIFALDAETGTALKDANEAQLAQVYRSILHDKRALLVLDNARDNAQVRPLLQANAAFLVTSRANLTEDGLQPLRLGVMRADEAEAYLIALCARLQSTDNRQQTKALCELCGYLPLALKIAGSYLAARPNVRAENYVAQLRQTRLELLRERDDEQANVEAAFQQTYDQLTIQQQLLFRVLSVFPAPFTLQAAAFVWGLEESQAEAVLGELVRQSFLEYSADDNRYREHDLLREFGEQRMTDDERRTAHKQHAQFYVQVARAARELYLKGNENILAGLNLFDQELPHIRAGQAWAAANMAHDNDAARLCSDYPDAAAYVAQLRLSSREHLRWLEDGVKAAKQIGDKSIEQVHVGYIGLIYSNLGQARKAIEYEEQALKLAREIKDRKNEGIHLGNLGNAYAALGEVRRAIEFYEQQLTITREIGDRRNEGNALGNLGLAYWNLGLAYKELGDTNKAKELWRAALAIFAAIEDPNAERVREWLKALEHE